MSWQGFTVKPHYFAPLLKSTAGSGDMDGKHYTLCGLDSFVYFSFSVVCTWYKAAMVTMWQSV